MTNIFDDEDASSTQGDWPLLQPIEGGFAMSAETTERFNGSDSFETRVLTALAAINGQLGSINVRLTALEEKVGAIDARLTAVEEKVNAIDARLTAVEQKVGAIEVRLGGLEKKVDALDQKVDALEEKVDARLRETRPIWESVLERLKVMDAKFDAFALDMFEMRAEIILIKKRVPPAA
ncbi:MAG TPA: hypothetical protein VF064_05275 [Pyrinomonadaceae bacterium]